MIVNPNNLFRGNKNLIRGGNFDTCPWSYALANNITPSTGITGVTRSTNNTNLPDSIIAGGAGTTTAAMTVQVAADAPTFAQCGVNVQSCLALSCTTAVSSPATTDLFYIGTVVDQCDTSLIANDYYTYSFWVKASQTGNFAVRFAWNGSTQKMYIAQFSVASANTWEQKVFTILTPNSNAAVDTATPGLKINFVLMAGSSFVATANSWITYVAPGSASSGWVTGSNNFFSSTSNTLKIALMQLEKGLIQTPFEYRSAEEETRLILPWAEAAYQGVYPAAQINTTTTQAAIPFKALKVIAATPTLYDGTGTLGNMDWIGTTNVSTSRATTAGGSRGTGTAQQTAALEYLASGSWRVDARTNLFNL